MGVENKVIRAGNANMFLSPVFRSIVANTAGARIELFDTDGAGGAARGAAMGYGYYQSAQEAFSNLKLMEVEEPDSKLLNQYRDLYQSWKDGLPAIL